MQELNQILMVFGSYIYNFFVYELMQELTNMNVKKIRDDKSVIFKNFFNCVNLNK